MGVLQIVQLSSQDVNPRVLPKRIPHHLRPQHLHESAEGSCVVPAPKGGNTVGVIKHCFYSVKKAYIAYVQHPCHLPAPLEEILPEVYIYYSVLCAVRSVLWAHSPSCLVNGFGKLEVQELHAPTGSKSAGTLEEAILTSPSLPN